MNMTNQLTEVLRLVLTVMGACLFFVGERYFADAATHWWLTGFGIFALLGGVLLAGVCLRKAKQQGYEREWPVWRLSIIWQALFLLSALVYLAYAKVMGTKPAPVTFVEKLLLVGWLVSAVLGFFMAIGFEWARMRNGRGVYAEPQRVRMATRDWLKVGMLAIVIACLNYAAAKRNIVWDLSYLKTTSVSDSTKKMVDALGQDIEVGIFFPQGNEVLSQAKMYFNHLTQTSSRLSLNYYDVELQPLEAERFRVSRNGYVVLKAGEQTERFDIGLNLASARKTLRSLDSEFQKALLAVTEKKKVLYFTRGHGELSWSTGDDASSLKSIKTLESYLRQLNFTMRFFGVGEGSANKVPQDADAIVIVGGDQPFLDEEVNAIKAYVQAGGKVLAMIDVDMASESRIDQGVRQVDKDPLVRWLSSIGVSFEPRILANATNFVTASRSEADVWFLYTNIFTSHESVQSLARNDQRAAVLTFRSGYLVTSPSNPDWAVFDTVRTLSDTFADENRDFKYSEGKEKREPRVIGAAVEAKSSGANAGDQPDKIKGRVVVFADATAVSDMLIKSQANAIYFVDSLRWLVGAVKTTGVAATEEDIRIRHTKKEDMMWFYGTIILVPGLVVLSGAIATRRARRQKRSEGGQS
jgi:hypothetical protein